jgi:hypothetical protein
MRFPVVGWIPTAVLAERAVFIYILVLYSEDKRYGLVRNYSTEHQNTQHHNEKKLPENLMSVCHHKQIECTQSQHHVNTLCRKVSYTLSAHT